MGRDLNNDKSNRSWLSNKLTAIKAHNLVERHYSSRTGKKKLARLSLTSEGKRALGRAEGRPATRATPQPSVSSSAKSSNEVNVESLLESVIHNVEILQSKLPSFVITFNIRPRREIGMSEQIRMGLKKF